MTLYTGIPPLQGWKFLLASAMFHSWKVFHKCPPQTTEQKVYQPSICIAKQLKMDSTHLWYCKKHSRVVLPVGQPGGDVTTNG